MSVKDELLFDFSVRMPRVLICGQTGILDNVRRILMISGCEVLADCGAVYASIRGDCLRVSCLDDRRMTVCGRIDRIEFFPGKEEHGTRQA